MDRSPLIAQVLESDHDRLASVIHLYVQTRGLLRADLHQQLSLAAVPGRTGTDATRARGGVQDQRTAGRADDQAVPGHWEGDLIGARTAGRRSARWSSGRPRCLHLPGRHADEVAAAMIAQMRHRRSITWDRVELAARRIQLACISATRTRRGNAAENTNRLLRHWFAKGTDLSVHTSRPPQTSPGLAQPTASSDAGPQDPSPSPGPVPGTGRLMTPVLHRPLDKADVRTAASP